MNNSYCFVADCDVICCWLQGGIYIVTLMDWFTLLVSFSIISLFELIVIIYIYGNRAQCDVERRHVKDARFTYV